MDCAGNINIEEIKCQVSESVYNKFLKESYGIKDCCSEYDYSLIEEQMLLIGLGISGYECLKSKSIEIKEISLSK